MLLLYIIVSILAVAIIIRVVFGEKVGTGYVYKVAFIIVGALFICFLTVGIYTLLTPGQESLAYYMSILSLFCSILLLPLEIWLGERVFKKRTQEEGKKLDDGIDESTDEYRGKISIGLGINTAGPLCYLLGWVSGIVFILIESENKFVRFHAMQSIIVFGILSIAGIIIHLTVGWLLFPDYAFYAFAFTLWVVLMLKAHHGKRYKLPWLGNLAEKHS